MCSAKFKFWIRLLAFKAFEKNLNLSFLSALSYGLNSKVDWATSVGKGKL